MTWLVTVIEPPALMYHVEVEASGEEAAGALARLAVHRKYPRDRRFDDLFVLLASSISDPIEQRQIAVSRDRP